MDQGEEGLGSSQVREPLEYLAEVTTLSETIH